MAANDDIKNTRGGLTIPPTPEDHARVYAYNPKLGQVWRELYRPVLPEALWSPKNRTGQPHRFAHEDAMPKVFLPGDPLYLADETARTRAIVAFEDMNKERAKLDKKIRAVNEALKQPGAKFPNMKIVEKGAGLWTAARRFYIAQRQGFLVEQSEEEKRAQSPIKNPEATEAPQWKSHWGRQQVKQGGFVDAATPLEPEPAPEPAQPHMEEVDQVLEDVLANPGDVALPQDMQGQEQIQLPAAAPMQTAQNAAADLAASLPSGLLPPGFTWQPGQPWDHYRYILCYLAARENKPPPPYQESAVNDQHMADTTVPNEASDAFYYTSVDPRCLTY